jgi:hypothetical protein
MSNLSNIIFAADDIESELVEVKQWGVSVMVKSMTAKARSKMIANAVSANGEFNLNEVLPDLVILCTFDPDTGEQVFNEGDRDALMAKSAAAVETIASIAMKLSGMTEDAVDEMGKDFSPTPTVASSLN